MARDSIRHLVGSLVTALQAGDDEQAAAILSSVAEPRSLLHPLDATVLSPLELLATNGRHPEAVDWLLRHGADVNFRADSRFGGALSLAVEEGNEDMTRHLLSRGAAVDVPDADGNTPLIKAVATGADALLDNEYDPHAYRDLADRFPGVVRLLLEAGADPNHRNHKGNTALMEAVRLRITGETYGRTFLPALIEFGARPDIPNAEGETPIGRARRKGDLESVALLEPGLPQ